jgi:hypothetical protein
LWQWYNSTNIVFGHYPSSCLYFKMQCFGDWILSPFSGKTYSVGPIYRASPWWMSRNIIFVLTVILLLRNKLEFIRIRIIQILSFHIQTWGRIQICMLHTAVTFINFKLRNEYGVYHILVLHTLQGFAWRILLLILLWML